MLNTEFAPWPSFSEEEATAISKTLLSNQVNYWTGNECKTFEKEFADWIGVPYAIALSNGTVALEAALRALNIKAGDEVIVTPRTFIASVSCIILTGATPIFADVDIDSQNITAETIRAVLSPKTKAIICVHLAGWPCDMDPIMALAEEHGLKVIEDCAQAHGAYYKGRAVGSIGHIAAWSFCQDKIMTTGGEGGMITTPDRTLWSRIWAYKDHGKSWSAVTKKMNEKAFRWVHETFGTNWRMIELQAAIGQIQLKKISNWHQIRLNNAMMIWAAASKINGLRVPCLPLEIAHAAYKCYVFVEPKTLAPGWDRDMILQEIRQFGVPCYPGSCSEVYLEKAFDNTPWRPQKRLPVARHLGETSLMFLVHPGLTQEQIQKTCIAIKQVMSIATQVVISCS